MIFQIEKDFADDTTFWTKVFFEYILSEDEHWIPKSFPTATTFPTKPSFQSNSSYFNIISLNSSYFLPINKHMKNSHNILNRIIYIGKISHIFLTNRIWIYKQCYNITQSRNKIQVKINNSWRVFCRNCCLMYLPSYLDLREY